MKGKRYQFIWWGWKSARLMGRRKFSEIYERPTNNDKIYLWSMRIGPVEVRRWNPELIKIVRRQEGRL